MKNNIFLVYNSYKSLRLLFGPFSLVFYCEVLALAARLRIEGGLTPPTSSRPLSYPTPRNPGQPYPGAMHVVHAHLKTALQ